MPAVVASTPPGLEKPLAVSREFHDIEPHTFTDRMSLSSEPDGHQAELVILNQLLQYRTEVPLLHQQIMELTGKVLELTSKVAELESQTMQTAGAISDLCGQSQPFQSNAREESFVPIRASTLEHKVFEIEGPPSKIRNAPPVPMPWTRSTEKSALQVPKSLDDESGLKVKSSKSVADRDGLQIIVETMRMEWTIRHFTTKLRSAMGRPLVSSPFALWDLEEIRLMITPERQEGDSGSRGRSRKEKEQFSKMFTNGPLDAGLSLKVPYARPCLLKYYFGVGTKETCPLECDFSTTAIDNRSGTFLGIDWLLEMDKDSSITVSVEMLAPTWDNLEDVENHQQ